MGRSLVSRSITFLSVAFSTNILISPPHESPTSQACSLVTPKSKTRTVPSEIVSSASPITAPSIQPPETEPTNEPWSSTASWLPTGRGEDPHVPITVARATCLPLDSQSAAFPKTSVEVAMAVHIIWLFWDTRLVYFNYLCNCSPRHHVNEMGTIFGRRVNIRI